MSEKIDVVIIGAGPAGLVLAKSLSDSQLDVRVIERRAKHQQHGQADGLKYVSIEILESLGVGGLILNEAYPLSEIAFWEPYQDNSISRFGCVPDIVPGLNKRREFTLAQSRIEDILLNSLGPCCQVEHSMEPVALKVDEDSIDDQESYPIQIELKTLHDSEPEQPSSNKPPTDSLLDPDHAPPSVSVGNPNYSIRKLRAKYVVGCDGARSWVRSQLGISMSETRSNSAWGVVDIIPKTNFPDIRKVCTVRSASAGSLLIIPREGQLVRLYVNLGDEGHRFTGAVSRYTISSTRIVEMAAKILFPYFLQEAHCKWWSVYQIKQQIAERYSKYNRIFLAGDAVHTHSPKAGQGMNTSIQDAFNLGWKLKACLKWKANPILLSTYESERMPIAEELIEHDKRYLKLFHKDRNSAPGVNSSTTIDSSDYSRFKFQYLVSQTYSAGANIRYPPNMIVKAGKFANRQPEIPASYTSYSSNLATGKRLHDFEIVNQSDGLETHIHKRLSADGRFRLLVFPGDLSVPGQRLRYEELGNEIISLFNGTGEKYYRKNEDGDSRLEIITVHTARRDKIELLDLPSIFHPWKEHSGWDYWKVYATNDEPGSKAASLYETLGLPSDGDTVALIRPDGVIAMIESFNDLRAIDQYFTAFLPTLNSSTTPPTPQSARNPVTQRSGRLSFTSVRVIG